MKNKLMDEGFTIAKVAQKLCLSVSTVGRWIDQYGEDLENAGIVKIKKVGFRRKIRVIDVERFVVFMRRKGAVVEMIDNEEKNR